MGKTPKTITNRLKDKIINDTCTLVESKKEKEDIQLFKQYTDSTSQFRSVTYPFVAVLRKKFEQLFI